MRILITGGCGFLGHHTVESFLKDSDDEVIVLDRLTYAAAGYDRLRDVKCFNDERVTILAADISEPLTIGMQKEIGRVDVILHLAAESHVDNSIKDPAPFVKANVVGTQCILDFARTQDCLTIYASTDEVYGPAPPGVYFKEGDPINPTNPYSATKAGGEALCNAYANTYKIPVIITNTMNLFGERQHPEKFIPLIVQRVLDQKTLYIHADAACKVSGTRFYLHCRNYAAAARYLIENGVAGEQYNIVGHHEVSNLDLALMIAEMVGKPLQYELVDFHSSRPGHDLRYALDGTKLKELGYKHPMDFKESLERTIRWTLSNERWIKWE